jgi:hypothetical protein
MAAFIGGLFIWRPRTCPDLRTAAATRFANAGVSEAEIDAIMG